MWKQSFAAILLCFVVLLGGCASHRLLLSEKRENAELYKNPADVAKRIESLIPLQTTKAETYRIMGITEDSPNVFVLLQPELRQLMYGDIQIESLEAAERLRGKMKRFSGVRIPYMQSPTTAVLKAPFHKEYWETGHDMVVILIFDGEILDSARIGGVRLVDRKNTSILFNPFEGFGAKGFAK